MKGWNILWLSLGLFFMYHVMCGPRSYGAYRRLIQEKQAYAIQAQTCQEHHAQWERLVQGMKSPVDPDVLEQQAWAVVGYVYPDEEVYFPPETSPNNPMQSSDSDI